MTGESRARRRLAVMQLPARCRVATVALLVLLASELATSWSAEGTQAVHATDRLVAGRAFYALHVADLSAPGWPSQFLRYDLFIASLGFSEANIRQVKNDIPRARILAYTDWNWA